MNEYGWSKEYCMWEISYAELFYWHDVIANRKFGTKIPKRLNGHTTPNSIHDELDQFIMDK